mmetsp:Transcript_145471/g.466200  ORF Transcript_145471/g.466200 Transcript_145471/m.466200 type:complete len:288 (+) Transcript_145471:1414-2277(+)
MVCAHWCDALVANPLSHPGLLLLWTCCLFRSSNVQVLLRHVPPRLLGPLAAILRKFLQQPPSLVSPPRANASACPHAPCWMHLPKTAPLPALESVGKPPQEAFQQDGLESPIVPAWSGLPQLHLQDQTLGQLHHSCPRIFGRLMRGNTLQTRLSDTNRRAPRLQALSACLLLPDLLLQPFPQHHSNQTQQPTIPMQPLLRHWRQHAQYWYSPAPTRRHYAEARVVWMNAASDLLRPALARLLSNRLAMYHHVHHNPAQPVQLSRSRSSHDVCWIRHAAPTSLLMLHR